MKKLFFAIAFSVAAGNAAAAETFQAALLAAAPTHPALFSFVDVYRLTVPGAATGGFPVVAVNDSPIRVAQAQAGLAPEQQFSVAGTAQPGRWVLLLAGIALALWVARRRLGYFF
jgi:hypothetical protein